jgi:hypothetical protein
MIQVRIGSASVVGSEIRTRPKWLTQPREEVTFEEVLVSAIATNDALAKLLIAKGIITEEEFNTKLKIEWARHFDLVKEMHDPEKVQ